MGGEINNLEKYEVNEENRKGKSHKSRNFNDEQTGQESTKADGSEGNNMQKSKSKSKLNEASAEGEAKRKKGKSKKMGKNSKSSDREKKVLKLIHKNNVEN